MVFHCMKKTPYVTQWIERAEDDYKGAGVLLKARGPYSLVCFHSQQAVEKILKGYLIYGEGDLEKIHQVDDLLKSCALIHTGFLDYRDDALYLTKFYITTRYPGDFPEFSANDAREAYIAAEAIIEFTKSLMM